MDLTNNPATSSSAASSSMELHSPRDTSSWSLQEEPEYLARYLVTKHSWRGRYRRILCISQATIITLDPMTLNITNSYDVIMDFEGAAPVLGRDDPQQQQAQEFTISLRTEGRGKFKAIKFSSRYRTTILSELHRLRLSKSAGQITSLRTTAEFPVLRLRRRSSCWVPFNMRITPIGVEVRDLKSGGLQWCLDFCDMDSPSIILLSDAYGRKGAEGGGFVLCPLFGRKCKAFVAASGVSNSAVLSKITSTAKVSVGVTISIDSSQSIGASDFLKQRAAAAIGVEDTPCGEWSVTRLHFVGYVNDIVLSTSSGIDPKVGLGGYGDFISRQLVLTRMSLVERRPDNYEVVIVRPLSTVSALVRFSEEPQMFAVEFNDGCPIHVFSSTSRDNLLAAVCDVVQTEGMRPLPVLPRLTSPGHYLDPPCGRATPSTQPVAHHRLFADVEGEALHLKHLAAAAKDAVAEGGSIPGSKARLWRRVREFNACVPYSGLQSNVEVPDVALMALLSMLPAPPNLPPDAPPPPPPSPKASATLIGLVSCLRRLLGSSSAASVVVSMPVAVGRIMGLLRSGSEGVASESASLVAMLIGRGAAESNLVLGSKGDKHAILMHAKSALFGHQLHATVLVNRLRPLTVSPLLSMAIVEVLEAMLCDTQSETTDHSTFVELLRQVAGLRRRLFALFGHPAESVRETVAVVMRTIAEEDAIAAESMRDAALKDGALLRHLVHAFFLPSGERCEVSRQLVALWADSYQPALDLLSRVIPPGLVAYLYTRPSDEYEDGVYYVNQTSLSTKRRQKRILQRRRGRLSRAKSGDDISSNALSKVVEGALVDFGSHPYENRSGIANHPVQLTGNSANVLPGSDGSTVTIDAPLSVLPSALTQFSRNAAADQVRIDQIAEDNSTGIPSFVSGSTPAPAQVVVESTPVGSGRLLCNWPEFWREFSLDHSRADLIWNERTRQELREALQAEVHHLDVEKERNEDVSVLGFGSGDKGSETSNQLSWNYAEFHVKFPSLSKEVCVGQYYLRLLLDGGGLGGRAQDFPLRDPVAFFRALYHRFLCDADIGLTVEGADPDELGASEDWCDAGRLDGFGGGGGSSVRELCARAMAIVYEQHHSIIGPFDGTTHITVLLDRTNDRALRHRLLLLLKVLMKVPTNVEACVSVGGCILAVDLLTTAHEASERTSIPLQTNLIAASAFVEPQKEWYYINKDGMQVGPMEKDAVRRAWSKNEIDWSTKFWALGMTDWKRLRDIRELRWALACRIPVLTPMQVGEAALSILHSMVLVHSDLDDAGEIVTPTPRVKHILSSSRCLPHIAQAILTGEPAIVEGAASLLKAIESRNPKAMSHLYNTGIFYFCLAYAGSNLNSISSLFGVSHGHQAFHGGPEAAVSSSLPLAKRSILGGLLPESLLYVLERSGPSVFAAAMVSDSDTPEIIWTHKMRAERLIDQVLKHLGDFPQKLSQHCHSLYDYAPMPPVTYPELQDEMWCHRYYLRNLCDEIRFPDWHIVEHVEFLQSLLTMWREELTRRPMDLSEEEACKILEISLEEDNGNEVEGNTLNQRECAEDHNIMDKVIKHIDEETLKRQYKKLAMKYHPDKNPEGREKFVSVQKAYERLQATLQGLQGPQPWRLQLLLKAQCILYRRYGHVLEPFKYAGYLMLLNAIAVDNNDGNFLSSERSPLLVAASELIWLTCFSSALNGEELVRDGGISLLATLLSRCINVVQRTTASTDPAAMIVANVMRTFVVLSKFESAWEEMLHCTGFVEDVVHCSDLEHATVAVDSALQTIAYLAASPELQEQMLKAGVIWYLLPLLLQYDSTAEESEAAGLPSVGSSMQIAKNTHAILAAKALGQLRGAFGDSNTMLYNATVAAVLRALLTSKLSAMLSDLSPRALLFNLNSNLESPEIIWNSSTRAELLKFVDQQRSNQCPDGSYSMIDVYSFKYKTLGTELHVGDVYLRIYNEQPDFELSDPELFCNALLEFLRELVNARMKDGRTVHDGEQPINESSKTTEVHEDGKVVDEDLKEMGDASVSSHSVECMNDNASEKELVKKITVALTSLQNLLASYPGLASIFVMKEQLIPIFECIINTNPDSGEVPQLCLSVLSRLTTYAPCVEAMVTDQSSLLLLLQLLHIAPVCRVGALRVLFALANTSELAWAAAKHGGVVYILELLLPVQEEIPLQQRAAAASLLGKLVAQPMHGPRVVITLARFLPDGLVSVIRDGPGDAVVKALEQTTETPELVWSPAMAASLSAQLSTMASDLYREQMKGRIIEWDLPEHASGQEEMRDEPQVGGVYVRLFLKDPKFPLRNPKRFLEGLLDQYVSAVAATHTKGVQLADSELPLLLSAALVSLLRVHTSLSDHVGHLGYIPKLVAAMANEGRREVMSSGKVQVSDGAHIEELCAIEDEGIGSNQTPQERVRLSCLRILHQLASSTTCAEAMATTGIGTPQVVPLLMKAIGWQGGSVLALETLKRVVVAGNRARDALVAQGLKVGMVQVLLGLLDWRAGGKNGLCVQMKWNESEASVGRVLAIEVLHAFASEGAHSTKVREILNASNVWSAYKDQKHDLFLPTNAQSAPAGVAGLIEGTSGTLTYALPAPTPRGTLVQISNSSNFQEKNVLKSSDMDKIV